MKSHALHDFHVNITITNTYINLNSYYHNGKYFNRSQINEPDRGLIS